MGCDCHIETVFKAWKSHLQFTYLPTTTEVQLRLLVYARLILVCLFQVFFAAQEQYLWDSPGPPQRALSLLKLASFVRDFAWMFLWADLSPERAELLQKQISQHCPYEQRKKRKNFIQKLYD